MWYAIERPTQWARNIELFVGNIDRQAQTPLRTIHMLTP